MFLPPDLLPVVSRLAELAIAAALGGVVLIVEGVQFLRWFTGDWYGIVALALMLGGAAVISGLAVYVGELADG